MITTEIAFAQWIQIDGPIGSTSTNGILENNGKLYIGTSCGLYSLGSTSGKWDLKANISLEIYAKKGDSLFVGTTRGIKVLDLSSPDSYTASYGQTLETINILAINSTDTCLYVGTQFFGFKKSKGFSDKWETFNDGLPYVTNSQTGLHTLHVLLIEHLSDVIFCLSPYVLFKTNVSPTLWSMANSGIPKEYMEISRELNFKFLKAIDETIFVGIQNKLYSSSNKGNSWAEVYSFGSNVSSLNKFGDNYYVTTLGNGIYISNDKGVTWNNSLNVGLGNKFVTSIKIFNDTLYAGTNGNGIWKHDIKNILLSNNEANKFEDRLNIYPNPASDFLHIQTKSGANFELKIVDLMGKQILSQHNLSSGKIDVSNIQNGTYIIILNSIKGVLTQKLVINR